MSTIFSIIIEIPGNNFNSNKRIIVIATKNTSLDWARSYICTNQLPSRVLNYEVLYNDLPLKSIIKPIITGCINGNANNKTNTKISSKLTNWALLLIKELFISSPIFVTEVFIIPVWSNFRMFHIDIFWMRNFELQFLFEIRHSAIRN